MTDEGRRKTLDDDRRLRKLTVVDCGRRSGTMVDSLFVLAGCGCREDGERMREKSHRDKRR